MSEQVVPNTDEVKVAMLAVALDYANKMSGQYQKEKGGPLTEAWEASFNKGVELARKAIWP